jgi:hypothetical protein
LIKAQAPVDNVKAGLDEKTYAALAEGAGRVIMASSRSSEVSLVFQGMRNSLFSHYLLEALRGASADRGDGLVRVFDVFHFVSDRVPSHAEANQAIQHPIFKAQDVETNFPLALRLGGKSAGATGSIRGAEPAQTFRPNALSPKARLAIKSGLVRRWDYLADYFAIPLVDKMKFPQGYEPQRVLEWLEERKRLGDLRDAFKCFGWDDLIEELDQNPI